MRSFTSSSNTPPSRRRNIVKAFGVIALSSTLLLTACAAPEPEATGSADDVTLTFLNQSRGQEAALNELARRYEAETGVEVVIDTPGPTDFPAKLQALSQSNSMPDVYSFLQQADMAPYIKAGFAMDLSEELEGAWGDSFSPVLLNYATFAKGNNLGVEPGIYSAHWEISTYGFLVDPAVTGIAEGEIPATVQEWIADLARNDETGAGTFSVAASLTPFLVRAYASNWLTDEEINDTINGDASWETEGWANAFDILLQLRDAGVLANGTLPAGADDNPTVEADFFSNHVLGAIFDQSSGISVGLRTAPDFNDYYSTLVLPAKDGDLEPRAVGAAGKGAAINPEGEHPEEALAFVKWLTAPEQQTVFAEVGRILPSNVDLLAEGDLPPQLAGIAAGLDSLQDVSAGFAPEVRSAIVAEVQRYVLGEITVDELLANIQAAQDRVS